MTAEKVLKKEGFDTSEHFCYAGIDRIKDAMIKFAQYHVTEALKAAWENAETICVDKDGSDTCDIDKESILTAYPLEKIK